MLYLFYKYKLHKCSIRNLVSEIKLDMQVKIHLYVTELKYKLLLLYEQMKLVVTEYMQSFADDTKCDYICQV